jgi:hypothetical protein
MVLFDPRDSIAMFDLPDIFVWCDSPDLIEMFELVLFELMLFGLSDKAHAWNARQTSTVIHIKILLNFILTPTILFLNSSFEAREIDGVEPRWPKCTSHQSQIFFNLVMHYL